VPSTTSLTTGELTEKSFLEWFRKTKVGLWAPILSLFDSNRRNIWRHFVLI
jgi:hypothetical protein